MIFQTPSWQLDVPVPWRAVDCQYCVEFTQPEGIGGFHISSFLRQGGVVMDSEARSKLEEDCPEGIEIRHTKCGEYSGYCAEYSDWNDDIYWRKWMLYCRGSLLFATYNCPRDEEELEAPQASAMLKTLRCRV